ncbi:MAG: RDD family protein [Thermoanaerobaculia bacterium]
MSEPPRDPLAEHPLNSDPARRRPSPRTTLELFPDVSEKPLGRTEESAPRLPAEAPAVPVAAPEPPARERSKADAPTFTEPEPAGGELEGPRAVAFARRVAAGLADLLILALVGAVELAAGALLLDLRFPPPAFLPLAAFLLLAALVLLVLAPFVWGTTPGMALADLRICAEDGGSPTLSAALLRFVGFLVTFALAGVPLLVAAFDRRGRTLADLVSRTTIEPVEAAEPSGLS